MKLRKLNVNDAERMLEWMHDEEVLKGLQAHMYRNKNIEDCLSFIEKAQNQKINCHMAIVDDHDTYQGTISLKYIDEAIGDAEFSIVLMREAWGKGYGVQAMNEIFRIAFEEYALSEVYWNVLKNNKKAISLYKKVGCTEMADVDSKRVDRAPHKSDGQLEDVLFFHVLRDGEKQ